MKLTKPQQRLLDQLRAKGSLTCSESYKPAQKLVALGLATKLGLAFDMVRLTPTREADGKLIGGKK